MARHPFTKGAGLTALTVAMALPSGMSYAEGLSPYLLQAQATMPSVNQAVPGTLVIDAADLSNGAMITHDGPVQIHGNIMGNGPDIEIRAPDIEIFGAVTGANIRLWTADPEPVDLQDVANHRGRLFIHGDVNVLNSRLGGAGTGELTIMGNASLGGFQANSPLLSTTLIGREVCVAGNLAGEGVPYTVTLGADELRVGRNVTGSNMSLGIYSVIPAMEHIREQGEVPRFHGRTLIGGGVFGDDIRITNGEVSIAGPIMGQNTEILGQRRSFPVLPEEVNCQPAAALSQAPTITVPHRAHG